MKELTETQKHGFCVAALETKKDLEWKYLDLGRMLHRIREEHLFEAGWTSWEEYCMELKMSQPSISKLLRIYEVFILHYGIEPMRLASVGGWSSIAEILPLIKPQETPVAEVKRLLGIVADQPRNDARKTILAERRGRECGHKTTRFLVLEICDDGCGERWNVTDAYDLKSR